MNDIDLLDWAQEQLNEARYRIDGTEEQKRIYLAVMQLLSVFEQQTHTERTRNTVLDVFNELARFHPLIEEKPEEWAPLRAGLFKKGDTVRVKADTYSDERGAIHNGRVGVIVDTRRGDVIFDSRDGREPELRGEHYRPEQMEGLMR